MIKDWENKKITAYRKAKYLLGNALDNVDTSFSDYLDFNKNDGMTEKEIKEIYKYIIKVRSRLYKILDY